jgi:glycosyltransferase involved in cell wall biosynthesis
MATILALARYDPLAPGYPPGGDVHRFFQLVNGFLANDFDVHVVALRPFARSSMRTLANLGLTFEALLPAKPTPWYKSPPIEWTSGSQFVESDAREALMRILDRVRPDYTFVAYRDFIGAAKMCGVPIIYDAQEIHSYVSRRWNAVAPALDAIMTRQDLDGFFAMNPHITPENIRVDDEIDSDEIADLRAAEVIFCPSRMEIEKLRTYLPRSKLVHLPITAKNISRRKDDFRDFALFSMGPNPFNLLGYYYLASKVADRLNASLRLKVTSLLDGQPKVGAAGIDLLGKVDARLLSRLNDAASFFVSPVYFGVGMQVKVMQALAHGLPVITMRSRFQDGVVEDDVCGYVVDDIDQLTERYIQLARDPVTLHRMSAAGLELVRDKYSPGACAAIIQSGVSLKRRSMDWETVHLGG